jgi:hypothetical protein
MFRATFRAMAMLAMAAASSAALAIPTYGNIADPPGVFFGSGNVNGNWTIDTSGGVEVALRAKNRATLATIDGSSGVYHAEAGLCNPTCSGAPKAMWNYELSVNTQGAGLTLNDVIITLLVDIDPSAGTNFQALNVLTNWPDNAYYNGSSVLTGPAPRATDFAVQQSANPLFSDSGFNFLPGAGLYTLELIVSRAGAELASVTALIAVPEPTSVALVGVALAAAGLATRRRKVAA